MLGGRYNSLSLSPVEVWSEPGGSTGNWEFKMQGNELQWRDWHKAREPSSATCIGLEEWEFVNCGEGKAEGCYRKGGGCPLVWARNMVFEWVDF